MFGRGFFEDFFNSDPFFGGEFGGGYQRGAGHHHHQGPRVEEVQDNRNYDARGSSGRPVVEEPDDPFAGHSRGGMMPFGGGGSLGGLFGRFDQMFQEMEGSFRDGGRTGGRGSFSSYSTVVRSTSGPGGVSRVERIERDSTGREKRSIRRTLGEKIHEEETERRPDGVEERILRFENMREEEVEDFETKWNSAEHALGSHRPWSGDGSMDAFGGGGWDSRRMIANPGAQHHPQIEEVDADEVPSPHSDHPSYDYNHHHSHSHNQHPHPSMSPGREELPPMRAPRTSRTSRSKKSSAKRR